MQFETVLSKFGQNKKIADYLKVTKGTVSKWRSKNVIPEKRARQLAMEMPGVFKFNKKLYEKKSNSKKVSSA